MFAWSVGLALCPFQIVLLEAQLEKTLEDKRLLERRLLRIDTASAPCSPARGFRLTLPDQGLRPVTIEERVAEAEAAAAAALTRPRASVATLTDMRMVVVSNAGDVFKVDVQFVIIRADFVRVRRSKTMMIVIIIRMLSLLGPSHNTTVFFLGVICKAFSVWLRRLIAVLHFKFLQGLVTDVQTLSRKIEHQHQPQPSSNSARADQDKATQSPEGACNKRSAEERAAAAEKVSKGGTKRMYIYIYIYVSVGALHTHKAHMKRTIKNVCE